MVTNVPAPGNPIIGEAYGPAELTASPEFIRAYVNATGDLGWNRHAARMRLLTGKAIAPPTIFDQYMAVRLRVRQRENVYSLHGKQSFEFRRPIEEGVTYTITGKLTDTYTRNQIDYLQINWECRDPEGELAVLSTFTQAFRFPGNHYRYKSGERLKPTVNVFLEQNEARLDAKFPDVGSVVEGVPKVYTQALMNLYSGPGSNIHTDVKVAQRRGHPDAIVQGLMSTALGCEFYRELFGPAWYTSGRIADKYINNMIANDTLTPIGVVASNKDGEIELRTAVYNQKLELTVVGTVNCKI